MQRHVVATSSGQRELRSASPYAPWGSTAPPPAGSDGGVFGGVQINERTALQLAACWGATSLISDSIATLPIQQWRLPARSSDPVDAVRMDPAAVIQQPCSEISQRDFVTQGTMSMLLQGTLWGRVVSWDDAMLPSQVQLIHPDQARVSRDRESGEIEVRFGGAPRPERLAPEGAAIRKMGLSVPGSLQGLSPIAYLRNTLGLARAQDLWAGAFFSNSATPNGVIQVEGDLDEDETRAMYASWLAAHQGVGKHGLPAILTGGAQWKPVTMSMADIQFLAQMQFSESVISGRIYRVPPHMLGMVDKDTSWGAGIEQQELGFVRNTLLIWLCRWEDLLSSWLPRRQFVTFDLSQRLRGDTLQRWSAYQIARVIGAMNNAEIRRSEGLAPVSDPEQAAVMEKFDQPINSSPVKAASLSTVGPGGDKSD